MRQADWIANLAATSAACRYNARHVAQALGVSLRQLQRLVRKHLGATPQSWLRGQRLEAARAMLRSASSVKEVAFSLGFSSQEQLARDFKRKFGVIPSALLDRASAELGKGHTRGGE